MLSCNSTDNHIAKLSSPQIELVFAKLKDGKQLPAGILSNGIKEGLWLEYDLRNGYIFRATSYSKGKKSGRELTYYKNNSIMTDTHYVNGIKQGNYISYFENGNPDSKGQYKNDQTSGVWEYYLSDGSLSKKIEFLNEGGKKVILDNGLEIPLPDEIPNTPIDSCNKVVID
ncbi:hypothetical protein QNI16_11605 [Cytophagaceae bacterium YF14B1]|uniref:Toxin-antitoxin system YwqK family antitoxin n=1 Tax=Xanthocytophaga flava TaxID=3048013 RepID=A0AAE3QKN8_9BACT|nr:hypothetical protein [Xanthocytophaga flavus]MDJ1481132.1 hypothetical protein [Xanthocytophaga flavus]